MPRKSGIISNKKFAVIRRMFDNQEEVTFRDRTVLMLTHDLQPVIDYIHGGFFKKFGLTTQVSAEYIENDKGMIVSQPIENTDLLNVVTLTGEHAKDTNMPLYVRVVNARKHIELTKENYSGLKSYDLLSNLIHGRMSPEDGEKQPMTVEAINKGIEELVPLINGYDSYEQYMSELGTDYLIGELDNDSIYFRILAIRLLFERCDGFMSKLRKEFPEACKFLNETNHIENDYVFQLNPEKFFSIPEVYVQDIKEFLNAHKSELTTISDKEV